MVDKMEFANGKYTVIHDNGKLTALRNGEPWNRDLVGDNLVYWMLMDALELKQQLDNLKQTSQQPVAWEYRSFHAQDTSTPGWGPWERLEPSGRYVGETAETMAADIQHYIDHGYKYELRALYSGPVMTKSTQDKSFESEDQMFNTNCWGMY